MEIIDPTLNVTIIIFTHFRGVGWRDAPGEMVAEGWKTVNGTSLRCAKGYDPETTPSPVFAELLSRGQLYGGRP